VSREGKNIIFRRGGGINIVFGPKYRPLYLMQAGRQAGKQAVMQTGSHADRQAADR
jgi:hypothetical protein